MKQFLHGNKVRAIILRSGYQIRKFEVHGENKYSVTVVGAINADNFKIDMERNILDNTGVKYAVGVREVDNADIRFTTLNFEISEYVEPAELTDSQRVFAELAEQDETIAEVLGYVIPADALIEAATPDTRPIAEDPMTKTLVVAGDKRCACGCGEKVYGKKSTFSMGHDARAKSYLRKFVTGNLTGIPNLTAELITYIQTHDAWLSEFKSLIPGWVK